MRGMGEGERGGVAVLGKVWCSEEGGSALRGRLGRGTGAPARDAWVRTGWLSVGMHVAEEICHVALAELKC